MQPLPQLQGPQFEEVLGNYQFVAVIYTQSTLSRRVASSCASLARNSSTCRKDDMDGPRSRQIEIGPSASEASDRSRSTCCRSSAMPAASCTAAARCASRPRGPSHRNQQEEVTSLHSSEILPPHWLSATSMQTPQAKTSSCLATMPMRLPEKHCA